MVIPAGYVGGAMIAGAFVALSGSRIGATSTFLAWILDFGPQKSTLTLVLLRVCVLVVVASVMTAALLVSLWYVDIVFTLGLV